MLAYILTAGVMVWAGATYGADYAWRSCFWGASAMGASAAIPGAAFAEKPGYALKPDQLRAVYVQWGHNMWGEALPDGVTTLTGGRRCNDHCKFVEAIWRQIIDHLALRKMNLAVIQNNWYYDEGMEGFDLSTMKPDSRSRKVLELFIKLDKAGFDQIPCASNWLSKRRREANAINDKCMGELVKFCRKNLNPERVKGYLMAPWAKDYDNPDYYKTIAAAIDQLDAAM